MSGKAPKKTTYAAIVGRIPGDDEDSCYVTQWTGRRPNLKKLFTAWIYDADSRERGERARVRKNYGTTVFINYVIESDAPVRVAQTSF